MFDWLRRLLGAAGGAVNNAVNTAGRFVQQNNPVNQWQQVQRQLPQVQRQIQRQIQPYIPRIQPPTPPPQLRQIQNLNIPRLANISADTARNVLGNIGKGYTNFAKQQEAKFRSDINLARNNPATFAVSKTPLLGAVAPFLDTSPVKLPKVDFTGYVDRSGDRIANTNVGRNPIVGFAGQNIVKPIIRSGARVADVMQGQEQYAPGIKGIAQLSTDAFNVGSLAYTPAKAGQLALGGKAALRVAPSAALRGAGAGAGISTLNQYADTGRINPTDVALSGLLGGVANVALPVAGGYAGRGLQRAGTAVKPVARELRLDTGGFAKLPGKNNPIDPLEALKAEARKYKSAEEFVKAQGEPVYHRSPNKFSEFDISKVSNDTNRQRGGWGLYFSDAVDAIPEDAYGKYLYEVQAPKGTLLDTKNPVDEKIVSKIVDAVRVNGKNPSELSEFSYNGYLFYKTLSRILGGDKEASLFLSKNGIDGLKRTISPTANDYILFNDKSIKTKQQLTDLYNQATKGAKSADPLEALKAEARKYKSAEEFVKAQGAQIGAEVRDKVGTKLQNPYTADYLPTNPDGTITLYHSTTKESAEKVKQSGLLGSKAEGGDIYFTTNKRGYGGIGKDKDVVLAFNVDPKKVKFDDVFRGELHLKGNNVDIGGIKPVEIKTQSQLTDLYNQAHAEAKTPQPTVEAKQSRLEQYGWRSETTSDGTKVYNRNGKHVATIKQGKNGRLTSYFADGEKMGSAGGSIDQYAEKIATQQFYAKKIEATPQNTGGTLRPDMKPIPTTDANKAMTADTDAAYKKQVDQRFAEADKRTKEMMAEMKWQKAREKFNTAEEYHLSEVDRLYKKYKNKTGYADSDIHRLKRRIINDHFDELDPETQVYFEHMAPGTDFENISKPSYRGFADASGGSGTEGVHASQIYELEQVVDEIRSADLYNQATAPQVGKTTQATLKQANELVEPQATQLDRMGAVSAPQTLSKTGVDISSQADNTPISLKIKGQMSDANYLKRFGKEREAVKIKIKPFTPEDYAFERWKDRGALSLGRETLERNLDRVAGKDAPKVKKFLVEQSRNNEFQRAQFLNSKRGEVKNYIVDQLGIKPRSKESALVQKYGEGLIDDVQLNQEAGARAPQIAEAASYFRSQYDELLDQWNAVRTRYGYDEVPKRQDYFRHFKEINDNIMQLGMIPKSRDLPTSISGITDIFRPNKPFSNAELRRYTNETTFDAVGGFDNYLDSVSRQIFHTDTVQRGRYVENAIRKQAEDNPEIELPNFVANLGEWTNLVSGKKTRIDRASEQLLGRKVYGLMDALRRKTSANMVGANLSSAMSNFIPFTQSISTTSKPSVIKGMMSSATSPLRGDVNSIDGEVSSYLTRRFAKDAIVKVKGAKAADIASTPFKWVDEFTSRSIVAGKYYENLSKGLNSKEAMKAADDYASKVITDRSIGQLPNLMNTKTIGFITQFQAEINNQVSFLMRDIPELAGGNKVKIANMLGQFVVFSYLFNTGYEKVMGRRPQIDPIQAGIDMYQALNADNDDTTSEKVISGLKKAGDRIATGLPFVSVFTGGRLPVNAMLPDVPALTKGIGSIGSPEGTQWGQFYKGVSGPAFYRLPPFGGGQAKKTLEGLYSYSKGESTTPAGRQRFEVAQTPANLAKSLVFGQYSTDEGKQYIKQLGENQSGQGGGSKDKEYLKAFDAGERKFLSMTKKEQEEYLKQDQRFNGTKEKYRIWKIDQEGIDLPEGISDQSRDVLTQLAKTSERDKKAFKDKNLYAVELAEYEKDKLEGKLNDIEDGKRIKSLQRNKVYNDFDPLVRDLYSLNKTEFFRYIKNNPNGKALFAQAVALDDALVAIGLKSKLRNKYGQILEPGVRVARAKKGRSKKGGGKGRKGGVAKTGVVRLKSPKLRLSMSVVPPKVGKVSLKTSPKLRPASAKPVAKLSRVGSVKVRSNA